MLNNYDIKLRIFRRSPRIRFSIFYQIFGISGSKMPFCVCADFLVRWYLFFSCCVFLGPKYLFFTYVFPRKSGEPTWPGKLVEGCYMYIYIISLITYIYENIGTVTKCLIPFTMMICRDPQSEPLQHKWLMTSFSHNPDVCIKFHSIHKNICPSAHKIQEETLN